MLRKIQIWRTYSRLGLRNLFRFASYRVRLKTGLHPVQSLVRDIGGESFFAREGSRRCDLQPPQAWRESVELFGWFNFAVGEIPPHWHENPLDESRFTDADQSWWTLPDFGSPVGDIKTVWELSRMDWVLAMAQRGAAGGGAEIVRLNRWLADWCRKNPTYRGPNWKCGQEASIRVLHLALAAHILGEDSEPSPDFRRLLAAHLARIHPTISFARSQANNHAVTEAAALFVGGDLLSRIGDSDGATWCRAGRRLLEESILALVEPDGTFSQYSVNYHRVMLEAGIMAECWRRWTDGAPWSEPFMRRMAAATEWLRHLTDAGNGRAPNLGNNDGALLLPLTDADRYDYRPAVEASSRLFLARSAYGDGGTHGLHCAWLRIPKPQHTLPEPVTRDFPDGGYTVMKREPWRVLVRSPRSRFRPHHCDALHCDLWYRGRNLICDAGSYSYAAAAEDLDYFQGDCGHSTVELDASDQMPRLGRFLRGDWLQGEPTVLEDEGAAGLRGTWSYSGRKRVLHRRTVLVQGHRVDVEDEVRGIADKAVVRWRFLQPAALRDDGAVISDGVALTWDADVPIVRAELIKGWQSDRYLQKREVFVLEVEIAEPGRVRSSFTPDQEDESDKSL